MHFSFPQKILFKHCDPAGIVFFPRYFEMINDAVEALFEERLGWPFAQMHPTSGVPTVAINAEFKAPSRLGDTLELAVTIKAIGTSSMTLQIQGLGKDKVRFVADQSIVCINQAGRPRPWPDAVRETVTNIMEGPT